MHHVLDQRLSDWKLPPSAWQSLPAQRSKLAAALPEGAGRINPTMIGRALDESFVHASLVMATGPTLAVASAIVGLVFIRGVARDVKST